MCVNHAQLCLVSYILTCNNGSVTGHNKSMVQRSDTCIVQKVACYSRLTSRKFEKD